MVRRHGGGQLRGPDSPAPRPARRPAAAPADRDRPVQAPRGAGRSRPAGPRRQDHHGVERHDVLDPRRGRRRHRAGTTGRRPRRRSRRSCSSICAAQMAGCLRSWCQGRADVLGYAADYAWLVDCCTRLGELSGDPRWTMEAVTHRPAAARAVHRRRARRPVHDRERRGTARRAASRGPRRRDAVSGLGRGHSPRSPRAPSPASDGLSEAAERIVGSARSRPGGHALGVRRTAPRRGTGRARTGRDRRHRRPGRPCPRGPAALCARSRACLALARAVPGGTSLPADSAGRAAFESPLLADREDGFAYLCRRGACLAPVDDADALLAALDARGRVAVRRHAVRLPSRRHRRPGAVRANRPGDVLRCLLLARGPEWVAVDVATGALVRSRASGWPVVATDSSLVAGASLGGGRGRPIPVRSWTSSRSSSRMTTSRLTRRDRRPSWSGTRLSVSEPPGAGPCAGSCTSCSPPTPSVPCSDHWVPRSRTWTSTARALRSRSSLPTGPPPSPATWQARGASSASEAASTASRWSTNASSTPRTEPGTAPSRSMPS